MPVFTRIWKLYYDGFRNMPAWGRRLWLIVIIKLGVMFLLFRLFLMPNYLNSRYGTFQEKSDHVIEQLISKP
ncbi:MAG: DUF4492 domain-containing protein [Odoribacteraceae bacterium]|jgi:hypothetical protein|nr:DUF4492 domain-containing protein [Odoribacteraceae bacterium]